MMLWSKMLPRSCNRQLTEHPSFNGSCIAASACGHVTCGASIAQVVYERAHNMLLMLAHEGNSKQGPDVAGLLAGGPWTHLLFCSMPV